MRKKLSAFLLSSSSTCSAVQPPQPWQPFRSHTSMIFLLVVLSLSPFLMNNIHAVQNPGMDEASVHKQSNNEYVLPDVRAESLNKHPEVRNSEVLDNNHIHSGGRDQNIINPNKQAVPQKEATVFPDKSRDIPKAHPLERLQDQENEIHRNEEIDEKKRKMIIKQKMEERDRFLREQLQQQELKLQQAKNQQQNVLETQKEQQREQLWLKEVHRKSQEVLAERYNKQQQVSKNISAVNRVQDRPEQVPIEVHDRPEKVPIEVHDRPEKVPIEVHDRPEKVPIEVHDRQEQVPHEVHDRQEQVPHEAHDRQEQVPHEVHDRQEQVPHEAHDRQEQVPHEVHDRQEQVPHEVHDRQEQVANEAHADVNLQPNLSQKNLSESAKSDANIYRQNSHNIINNTINDNNNINKNIDNNNINNNNIKAEVIIRDNQLNNNSHRELPEQNMFVQAGESGNIQSQQNHHQEVKPIQEKVEEISNKINNNDPDKNATGFNSIQIPSKEINVSISNSDLGVPVAVNPQNNLNAGNQNEQKENPSNVINNNNNQWAKYEFNNAQQQQQQQQQQQSQNQPQIGGINLSWDWEDFSVMFNSYGAAEMKVRRSPHPTTGEPWPLPQYYSKNDEKIYKVSKELHFIPTGVKCDILEEALTRHLQRTLRGCVEDMYDNLQNAEGSPIEDPSLRYERDEFLKAPLISRVEVKVRKPCEKYPSLESDESYDLVVKKRKTYIWANEVWGALRGLETFGHLVWRGTDGFLYMRETVISDYPRFPHRGLHIDTSRHFLFKEVILDILDSMEMNKLNVFHWHIVDDQSFPYESKVYPELSRKGAFHPSYVYTLEDIAEIIEYARMRGIRVMPEFDTPENGSHNAESRGGKWHKKAMEWKRKILTDCLLEHVGHTFAWGLSRPELLTQCYSGSVPVKGYLGPIDPSKNSTYRFLQTLFKEIMEVFKDQYLHLGGDEVPLGCWQSNPEVAAFAQELAKKPRDPQQNPANNVPNVNFGGGWSMWSDDIRRVYEYYENRLITILNEIGQKRKKGIKYVMWQEVMNNNLQLPNDTIIQVWMGDMADVMRATSMGYQVIYSTCWYMDHIEYGTKWPKYYNCDPVDQSFGFHIDEKKVLGGEAAFWAEYFSNENLIPLMWPRASAAAERLWSSKEVKNLDKAAERLAEHRCRMIKRGINAGEINGPGYCLHSPPKRRLFNDTAGCKGGNCSRTHNFVQIEDFEVHVSQRGGSLADCGNVFTPGNSNVFILLTLALIVVVALYALSKSSSQFHRMRICKNRSILIVFVGVLLVYLLCYTTIWMRAFEFSGSFHKTLQEDNRSGFEGGSDDDSNNFRPISS